MNTFFKKAGFAALLAASSLVLALPADFDAKIEARPQADRDHDAVRKPRETMEALGVQEGWVVVDVAAGYFTRVLSAAVGPNGKVLSQVGARALETNNGQAQKDMAAELGNVEPVFGDMASIPAGSVDAALTAQNYHDAYNFRGEEGSQAFLKAIFDVLKPGGVAVIIDHEGNEGAANADLHRIPVATARAQIEAVGFEIVTESDVLDNPADDHTLGVREESVRGKTDQFLLVVRKPG